MKRVRRFLGRPMTWIVVVLIAAAAAGGWWWGSLGSAQATTAPTDQVRPTATTTTAEVTVDTITKSIEASGKLGPAVSESVTFPATATVTTVDVEVGDEVKTGDRLGTIDTLDLEATLASARSTLAQATAKVASAQTAVDDAADTDDDGDDDEVAAAQLTAAQKAEEQAKAAVQTAEDTLALATATAPVDGIVTEVNVTAGQSFAGSSGSGASMGGTGSMGATGSTGTSGTSSAAFVIIGTDKWQTQVTVNDAQIGLLRKGIQAELTVDGRDEKLFGKVTSVGLVSTSTSSTASYPVVVTVTGSQPDLHDGAAATVTLIYQQISNVLVVPSAAVSDQDGATVVTKLVDGEEVVTPVETGESSGSMMQIVSGLAEGDQVSYTMTFGSGNGGGGGGQFPGGDFQPPDGFELPDGFTPPDFSGGGGFPGGGGGFPGGG